MIVKLIESQIVPRAANLARGLITLFFSQSIIAEPKYGKEVSQECIFFELLLKHNAERIINGVVGKTGRKAPITPRIKEVIPIKIKKGFKKSFKAFYSDNDR
jgi:hypothetical protein